MARWKARDRLPIGANWTFFASYHGWGAMSRYWSKLRCLKGGASLWTQISGGKGRPPPTIFGIRKLESLGYRIVKKLLKISTGWVGRTNVTDRRQTTDRQTTDGSAMAYSKRNVSRSRLLKTRVPTTVSAVRFWMSRFACLFWWVAYFQKTCHTINLLSAWVGQTTVF